MRWTNIRPLPAPIGDRYELVEDREYPLVMVGDRLWVMRRHRRMLQAGCK